MVADVTFNGKLYFFGNEGCRQSRESYATRKSSVNFVLRYQVENMIYIYLLFPFVYAKYIIFEKRSLTFQCTGLSRLAKICLRESPESKMTHVKYNCASLCNIVKERTAWNIVT